MISCAYIARKTGELTLQLDMTRHFLVSPESRGARDQFIEDRVQMARRSAAIYDEMQSGVSGDEIDHIVQGAFASSTRNHLANNFLQLREFSEHRLLQMELLIRYSVFESLFAKIVGNILWEYPDRLDMAWHFLPQDKNKRAMREVAKLGNQDASFKRAVETRFAVSAVDHLLFAEEIVPQNPDKPSTGRFVRDFVTHALGLDLDQAPLCYHLERAREIRNRIVHEDPDFVVPEHRMPELRNAMFFFLYRLCESGSNSAKYPNACSLSSDEALDDNGEPGYRLVLMSQDLL